jgi:hypothetical protein
MTKGGGFLYKPRRLPDRHLAIFASRLLSPLFIRRRRCRLSYSRPSSTRPSLTRGSSLTRHSALMRRPSPTHAHRRLSPPASSTVPTSAPHRGASPRAAPLPDTHLLPNSPPPPALALLLHERRRRRSPWARLWYLQDRTSRFATISAWFATISPRFDSLK